VWRWGLETGTSEELKKEGDRLPYPQNSVCRKGCVWGGWLERVRLQQRLYKETQKESTGNPNKQRDNEENY
jgi:hypothetical protein